MQLILIYFVLNDQNLSTILMAFIFLMDFVIFWWIAIHFWWISIHFQINQLDFKLFDLIQIWFNQFCQEDSDSSYKFVSKIVLSKPIRLRLVLIKKFCRFNRLSLVFQNMLELGTNWILYFFDAQLNVHQPYQSCSNKISRLFCLDF